jgi:hypothetical protein
MEPFMEPSGRKRRPPTHFGFSFYEAGRRHQLPPTGVGEAVRARRRIERALVRPGDRAKPRRRDRNRRALARPAGIIELERAERRALTR